MIRVEDLEKHYGHGDAAVHALRGVSLAAGAGEFVSIMGASGSGKSTLLHLLAGLDVPSRGTVTVAERRLDILDDDALTLLRRRHVGLVFQFFNLLPTLTAEENVALPLLLDGRPRRDALLRARDLLCQVGLAARCGHRPDALSGGEMQRVAIARALVIEPAVLLADEPTGNLDSRTGAAVLEMIRAATAARGVTVVMVTHDAGAAAIGDRIVALADGRVVTDEAAAGARLRRIR